MSPVITTYTSVDELETKLCQHIGQRLQEAISANGEAFIVVSGGSSPKGLYQRLAVLPLPWEKVTITLSDERWVPPDHQDSNERLVRGNLMVGKAKKARFISLKTADDQAENGIGELADRLSVLPDRVDLVLLGMGNDGHIASLFPYAETLRMALSPLTHAPCMEVIPPDARWVRITLTLTRLLASQEIILLLFGEEKMITLKEALNGDQVSEMPVRAILNQSGTPVQVVWTAEKCENHVTQN